MKRNSQSSDNWIGSPFQNGLPFLCCMQARALTEIIRFADFEESVFYCKFVSMLSYADALGHAG